MERGRIPDTAFATAYAQVTDRKRAWIKTGLAAVYAALGGPLPILRQSGGTLGHERLFERRQTSFFPQSASGIGRRDTTRGPISRPWVGRSGGVRMWIAGKRQTIPMDRVSYLDDAAQICYQNGATDTFTCFDALYMY